MSRILIINPNSSEACSSGIAAAIAPFSVAWGPVVDVVTLRDGPPAICTWQDWHSVVRPMCRLVERESADIYIIACASDPGIDALRAVTIRPVLGIFRSAVAMAVARAERFGVIGLVASSKARHRAALRAMGLEDRLAGEIVLDVSMDALLDPKAARPALIAAARGTCGDGRGNDHPRLHRNGAPSAGGTGCGRPSVDRAVAGRDGTGDGNAAGGGGIRGPLTRTAWSWWPSKALPGRQPSDGKGRRLGQAFFVGCDRQLKWTEGRALCFECHHGQGHEVGRGTVPPSVRKPALCFQHGYRSEASRHLDRCPSGGHDLIGGEAGYLVSDQFGLFKHRDAGSRKGLHFLRHQCGRTRQDLPPSD